MDSVNSVNFNANPPIPKEPTPPPGGNVENRQAPKEPVTAGNELKLDNSKNLDNLLRQINEENKNADINPEPGSVFDVRV
jgi:hypothetical protein